MHDIKFVWSFLQGGFVASPLRKHFPALASRDPPEDLSPDTHLSKAEQSVRPLSVILSETLSTLSGKRKPEQHQAPTEDFASPPQPDESINSSLAFSPDRDRDDTPRIISSPPDSPASLDEGGEKDADAAVERDLIAEPWVWANTLLEKCRKIVVDAVGHDKGKDSEGRGLDPGGGALYTERVVGEVRLFVPLSGIGREADLKEDVWVAFVPEESRQDKCGQRGPDDAYVEQSSLLSGLDSLYRLARLLPFSSSMLAAWLSNSSMMSSWRCCLRREMVRGI